jgi:AcrR family transcriptional regulator
VRAPAAHVKSERSFYDVPMPRVSQAHLDARREQILTAARSLFARNGFEATSMQDIFRESGLSTGAVYRYFRSRDEIVEAIAQQALGMVHAVLDDMLTTEPPAPLEDDLARVAELIQSISGSDGMLRVTVQLWGQALFKPEIGSLARGGYGELRTGVTRLVRRAQQTGQVAPDADAAQLGQVLFAVLLGFIVQRLLLQDVDAEGFRRGLRVLLATPGGGAPVGDRSD